MPAAVPGAYTETDLIPIRRALLSVSDKTGIVELARGLIAAGAEIDLHRRHRRRPEGRRGLPSPTSTTSPASRKSWMAGSRPCTR